jgi:hypothetical protein
MNSIRLNLVPATVGSIAMAWFASHANVLPAEPTSSRNLVPIVRYREASLGTHGDLASNARQATIVPAATASLVNFYADLLAGQQELGTEFEKVLYDNLWDLYAR